MRRGFDNTYFKIVTDDIYQVWFQNSYVEQKNR